MMNEEYEGELEDMKGSILAHLEECMWDPVGCGESMEEWMDMMYDDPDERYNFESLWFRAAEELRDEGLTHCLKGGYRQILR